MSTDKRLPVTVHMGEDTDNLVMQLHPSVLLMAQRMQDKLNERIERYPDQNEGEDNWLSCRINHLVTHMQKEVAEFSKASFDNLIEGEDVDAEEAFENLQKEGADVCNLVMMVIDRVKLMKESAFKRFILEDEGDREYIKD